MGLSIQYSGMLRSPDVLPLLIQEAIDIAKVSHWNYEIINEKEDIPVSGILVIPEGSEPLWFTFHREGFMCNPLLYEYVLKVEGKGIPAEAPCGMFTKTQYAGVDTHMEMIKFMRYISDKYFKHFEMSDESQYWETGDEAKCREIFARYDHMMKVVGDALNSMEIEPGADQKTVIRRIKKMMKEKFPGISITTIKRPK
jgi:hypothetical protein